MIGRRHFQGIAWTMVRRIVGTIASGLLLGAATAQGMTLVPGQPITVLIPGESMTTTLSLDTAGVSGTGAGVRVHFDSTQISNLTLTEVLSRSNLGVASPQTDQFNLDGDPQTDMYVLVSWIEASGDWPGVSAADLFDLSVTAAPGFNTDTSVNVSTLTPPGAVLTAQSVRLLTTTSTTDSDSDGMPDTFELQFAFDPLNGADAALDFDNDGSTNLQEFLASTNPIVSDTTISCDEPVEGAMRLAAGQFTALPVRNLCLTSAAGAELVVPSIATAASLNITAVTPSGPGFLTVWPCGVERPLASNLNFVAGDVIPNGVIAPIGSNGKVCIYAFAETELVVDVAGWFEGDAFVGATPQRSVDTRDGTGGQLGQLVENAPLTIKVTNIAAKTAGGADTLVPMTTSAVALNVTVVNPAAAGFVTVYPCDVPRPLASNVNFVAGQVVANGVVAPAGSNGEVCVYSLSATDIVVDLAGWFPGAAFTGATPTRLVDTRTGVGSPLQKLDPSSQLNVAIHAVPISVNGSAAQVPLDATAAVLNVTVVNPESSGFATVWPCSAARPLASNLNFVAGQVVANNVTAPIGDQGQVCFYTNVPSDIIVDIAGYFSEASGNEFVGSTPKRLIDTRSGLGPAPE